jgi:hypothetical protein
MRLVIAALLSLLVPPLALAAETKAGEIVVDKEKRTITVPARIAPRVLPQYAPKVYPIEVIATWPHDRKPTAGQKAHETIITFDVKPSEVHAAIESVGLKPGKPVATDNARGEGPEVKLYLELPAMDGKEARRVPMQECMVEMKTRKPLRSLKFVFTGSVMTQPSPDKDEKVFGADLTGTLITLFPVSDQTVIQSNLTKQDDALLDIETNKKVLPPEGTAVKLVIDAAVSR